MKTVKGPGIFLAQFLSNNPPFNSLGSICQWAKEQGFTGVQLPTWDSRCLDLKKLAESKTYADEIVGIVQAHGLQITELSTHLQGQLVAVNPAYDLMFDDFAPQEVKKNPKARVTWAKDQLLLAAKASYNLGLSAHATFSGSFLWHTVYPWPQRPAGLVDEAFAELASRWRPILDRYDEYGIDVCYELHPGEDLHDGITFELFLKYVKNHPRACILYDPSHFILQCLDYLQFIDFYKDRIRAFHVKDAEFLPNGKQGVYGGYQDWANRAGRFRSLGDGQIDFKSVFSKMATYNYPGWAVLEWECCLKDQQVGAREGASFIKKHIIPVTYLAFDDFAGNKKDTALLRKIAGIS